MATKFRPGNSQARFSWEANKGYVSGAPALAWKYFRLGQGGVGGGDASPLLDPGTLEPREQMAPGLPGLVTGTRELNLSFEPSGLAFFLAAFQERSAAPSEITSGQSYLHKLAPNESNTEFSPTFALQIYRDTPFVELLAGCKVNGLTFNFVTGAVVTMAARIGVQRTTLDSMANVVLEGGTPTSRPVLSGIRAYDYLKTSLADPSIYYKYTQVSPSLQVKSKLGAAASYSGSAQNVTAGTPLNVVNESGVELFDPDSPLEFYLASATGITLNDEYRFDLRASSVPWVASFPALRALNCIHVTAKFAGTKKRIKQCSLTMEHPSDHDHNLGERFSPGLLTLSNRVITATISRRHIDTEFEEYLRTGKAFTFDIECDSRQAIGSSTDRYYARFVTADARFEGNPANPASPGDFPENLTIKFYPSSDGTHPDDITTYVRNERSSLAA